MKIPKPPSPIRNRKEKRDSTLYVRVKPSNKAFLERYADKCDMSLSEYIDNMVDQMRKGMRASNKRKS